MGMGPIGAFKLDYGPETPAWYLLIPGRSIEELATIELRLVKDTKFTKVKSGSRKLQPRKIKRVESSLLAAFEGPAAIDAAGDDSDGEEQTHLSASDLREPERRSACAEVGGVGKARESRDI